VFPFARTKSTPFQPQPDESSNLHNLHLENSGFNLNYDHTCIRLPANSLDAEDTSPPESAPSQLPLGSVPIIGARGSAPEASAPGTPPSTSPAAFDQDGPASAPGSPAATQMLIGLATQMIVEALAGMLYFLVAISFPGVQGSKQQFPVPALSPSTRLLPMLRLKLFGYKSY
jgi:hypothetical protein